MVSINFCNKYNEADFGQGAYAFRRQKCEEEAWQALGEPEVERCQQNNSQTRGHKAVDEGEAEAFVAERN